MTEYIKREDVIDILKRIPGMSFGPDGPYYSRPMEGLVDPWWILDEVRDLPTTDVRENVHICPWCGADMRRKGGNDDDSKT